MANTIFNASAVFFELRCLRQRVSLPQADCSASEFYDHLAAIVATEQCQKCIQSFVEVFINCFLILNFARLNPSHHFAQELWLHVRMFRYKEAGNHSARGHAPEWIHHVEGGLQMLSAYVLKVDINPLRSCPQVL